MYVCMNKHIFCHQRKISRRKLKIVFHHSFMPSSFYLFIYGATNTPTTHTNYLLYHHTTKATTITTLLLPTPPHHRHTSSIFAITTFDSMKNIIDFLFQVNNI
ncbi:hypothetical protein ACB094_01G012700 [Castanea mollissima]